MIMLVIYIDETLNASETNIQCYCLGAISQKNITNCKN